MAEGGLAAGAQGRDREEDLGRGLGPAVPLQALWVPAAGRREAGAEPLGWRKDASELAESGENFS